MRLVLLILVSVCLLWAAPQEKEAAAEEPAPLPPPRITRSNGVVTIRGTTSQAPRPEPKAEEAPAGEGAEAPEAKPEQKEPEPPKPPRRVSSSSSQLDANGRQRSSGRQVVVERKDGVTSTTDTIRNSNGRRVPYITEQKREISSGAGGGPKVTEQRTQRYDTAGRPSQQELVRTEERKLPGGAVERTEVVYRENLNGRMEAVERTVEVVKESGAVTTTTKRVEKPSVNGRFEAVLREESTERREGENKATLEKVKSASFGGRMQVVEREQSTMTKTGAVAKTETEVYERQPGSGQIELSSRSGGTLEERADGLLIPPRPGSYMQAFPGSSVEQMWQRHIEAEVYLRDRRGYVPADFIRPPDREITDAVQGQISYVRSLAFWPLRIPFWYGFRVFGLRYKSELSQIERRGDSADKM